MSQDRIESMRQFARQFPDNPFPRYAVALELKKAGRPEEAVEAFRELVRDLPAYVPSYLQFGMLLEELGRNDDAREVLRTGIERAREAKDQHALSEMEGVLDRLD